MKYIAAQVVILILFQSILTAQWERTKGPSGGFVSDLDSNEDYLFATSTNGIYRTQDGHMWERLEQGLPKFISCSEVDVYNNIVAIQGYIDDTDYNKPKVNYLSYDAGNSWSEIALPDSVTHPDKIVINDQVIIIADDSVLKSVDGGATWTAILTRSDSFFFAQDLAVTGDQISVLDLDMLWISNDWGSTWQAIPLPVSTFGYYIKDDLIIVIGERKAFRSIDGGQTWLLVDGLDRFANTREKDIVNINDTLYANSGDIWVSVDNGMSWEPVSPSSNQFYFYGIGSLNSRLFGNTVNGIFEYNRYSEMLVESYEGIDASITISMCEYNGSIFCAAGHTGLAKYDPEAEIWTKSQFVETPVVFIQPFNDTLIVATKYQLFKSEDGGNQWTDITPDIGLGVIMVGDLFVIDKSIFVYDDIFHHYLRSDDGGRTWTDAMPTFYQLYNRNPQSLCGNGVYYFGSIKDSLYRSADTGETWQNITQGLVFSGGSIKAMHLIGDDLFVSGISEDSVLHPRMFRSNDFGDSWSDVSGGLPESIEFEDRGIVDVVKAGDFHVMSFIYQGAFILKQNETQWKPLLDSDHSLQIINDLLVVENMIYAATFGRGVWKMDAERLSTSPTVQVSFADDVMIYPNPANKVIHIQSWTDVGLSIYIYDMNGSLRFKSFMATDYGEYDISGLPPGVYVVVVSSTAFYQVGKFLKTGF